MTAYVSALDLFSIGIGPSSSHTVGPMRAAGAFAENLAAAGILSGVRRISCSLYGSLGATGLGHGTPDAILAGLTGLRPEACDPDEVRGAWSGLSEGATLMLAGTHEIPVIRMPSHCRRGATPMPCRSTRRPGTRSAADSFGATATR
jgi:L-serine dehydratase